MNTITRETELPDGHLFDELIEEYESQQQGDHLKSDIFEMERIYEISADNFPDLPEEFHGYWRSETFRYSMENGPLDKINSIHRVKLVQQTHLVWVHDFK
jgi:hypothetical protein